MKFYTLSIVCSVLLLSCSSNTANNQQASDPAYIQEIEDWHKNRAERLTSSSSWLSLAGLFWLKEGDNTFGAADDNQIVFPTTAPAHIGVLTLIGDSVLLQIHADISLTTSQGDSILRNGSVYYPQLGAATTMEYQNFSWTTLKRGDRLGIRLKDSENPVIQSFTHIDHFPIAEKWKVKGEFVPFEQAKQIPIEDIIGMTNDTESAGQLKFSIQGKELTLDVLDGGKEDFFMIFRDATTGESTYGGGRYLYVPKPKGNQSVYLDFNKAYNPPCAFTAFATCPLPPPQNFLEVAIEAGEKNYGTH